MDYYSFQPSSTYDRRSAYSPFSTWTNNNNYTTGIGVRIDQSGRKNYSTSPVRRIFPSASYNTGRYGSLGNISYDRSSSNDHDYTMTSLSRSRDKSRRFSVSGRINSPSSYLGGSSISGRDSYSPLKVNYNRRSFVHGSEHATQNDFLEKLLGRPNYKSYSSSPSYSPRINFTPTHMNLGPTYRSHSNVDNSNERDYLKDSKRFSYVSNFSPSLASLPRKDLSTPIYSRYSTSPGYLSSASKTPRSSSMSRFSFGNYSENIVEKDEPFGNRIFKVLNKYSSDVYDNKSFRDYTSKPSTHFDYRKIATETDSSLYGVKAYDPPRKSARELYNDIKEILADNKRESGWMNRTKEEYGKHQRRLSTLLMSHNESSNKNLQMPDNYEATFTSTSRRSISRDNVINPIIKIENDDTGDSKENSPDKTLEHLLEEQSHKNISNRELTKLFKTDSPEELARILLDRGESFKPNEISHAILPSGKTALVMTQTKQTAVGDDGIRRSASPQPQSMMLSPNYYESNPPVSEQDQEWANDEIEKFTQLTGEFEESLQTLEHFIGRNRCLFPENLIIYQKIVYHKSSAEEIAKQGLPTSKRFSFIDDKDVCAVRVREKLVLPHGCRRNGYDVMEMLKRCYPRFDEVEVVYDDEENIKETLLKQENGQLDFDHPTTKSTTWKPHDFTNDDDSGRNSPAFSDEDELLQKCRKGEEGLPSFVTKPRSQSTMVGQPVRFTCSITGNPEPEVQWYKDGLPLPRDGRFIITNNFGICSLRICATRPDDRGVYTVEVENSVGAVSVDVDLEIQLAGHQFSMPSSSLSFTRIPPYYVHMSEGDPLTLRCKLQGDIEPKITWYKGSKELRADDKYRLVAESPWQHMMQIKDLCPSDAALYTVLADDGLTSVRHSVEVNVAPKRDIDDTITEYEIVKKMGPIKMAPIFVKELPLQHRMKEGSNLLIGCAVDESDPQPHLIGVEIVEKKRKRSEGRDSRASDQSGSQLNYTGSPEHRKDASLAQHLE